MNIGDRVAFSKGGNLDSITAVDVEFDGTTHAMGREYKIDIVQDGEDIFLPLNEILYLLHSQWCMENDCLAVQPLPYTIIDFLGSSNLEYMWQNKVNQTDLLINGESELAHNLRSSLAAVFNDFDPMMFILWWPEEGMTPALNKEYEETLLQLAVDDKDFLDSYGQAKIAENLAKIDLGTAKSDFASMKNILDIPENLMDGTENINEVVGWISELSNNKKSIKFNIYSDALYMTPPRIRAWSKELGDITDVLEIADLLINVSEVSQRSQHWGEDFINQISILTNFDNIGYNTTIANRVKNVASNLIEEYQDPINAAADEAALQTTALFLNKIFDESLFGKYFSIFNAGLAIAKTDENIKNSIDAADLSYMVDCLIKTEQIAMNEMNRNYQKILDTIIYGDLAEQDIERLRNCVMLSLRTNLRNHAFIYYLNEKLTDDSNWKNSTHAQEIQNQIINDYALLCQVMETEPHDKLIILNDFDNMYSDEYGMVRQKVTTDIFHEGELPLVDKIELVIKTQYDTTPEMSYEYATISAYSDTGDIVWSYETPKYVMTEMTAVVEIGQRGNSYYFVENTSVVCIDVQSGAIQWKNDDYAGRATSFAFGENAIYLCGQYGPDFYAISYDGTSLAKIEQFSPEYYWASKIELLVGVAAVYLYGGTEDYDIPMVYYVDLETFDYSKSYSIKSNEPRKNAYMQFINEQEPLYDSFDGEREETYKLIDINGDDIPELYICKGFTFAGDIICTYANDSVQSENMWVYGFSYLEGQNLFMDSGGHMDTYHDIVYSIVNGKITEVHRGEYGAKDNSQVQIDHNGEPIYRYIWDGIEVTKDEYNIRKNDAYNGQEGISPITDADWNENIGRYSGNGLCTYFEIIEAIYSY